MSTLTSVLVFRSWPEQPTAVGEFVARVFDGRAGPELLLQGPLRALPGRVLHVVTHVARAQNLRACAREDLHQGEKRRACARKNER